MLERASVIGLDFWQPRRRRSRHPAIPRSGLWSPCGRSCPVRPISERSVPDAYRFRHLDPRRCLQPDGEDDSSRVHERYADGSWNAAVGGSMRRGDHRVSPRGGAPIAGTGPSARSRPQGLGDLATSGRRAFERVTFPPPRTCWAGLVTASRHPAYLETLANLQDCMFMSGSTQSIVSSGRSDRTGLACRRRGAQAGWSWTGSGSNSWPPLGSTVKQLGEAASRGQGLEQR